jgi:hypothetical protein
MDHLIPPAVAHIFADPPLVRGEDKAAYQAMVAQLGAESGAASVVDWLPVKDVADLTWQIARTRRWISACAVHDERAGLASAIKPFVAGRTERAGEVAAQLAHDHVGEGSSVCTVLMAKYALPADIGQARGFFWSLRQLSHAEDLLMRLEYRRERALAQIEARRAAFGAALRTAANRVVDAEAVAHDVTASPALAPPLPEALAEADAVVAGG